MSSLIDNLAITSPIFILIGLGFFAVRRDHVNKEGVRSLAWFILNLALPALIFSATLSRPLKEIILVDYLLVYGLGSLSVFVLLFLFSKWRNRDLTTAAILALGGSLSNSLMIGFPVVTQLFGSMAIVPFTLTLIVENLLIIPLALIMADIGKRNDNSYLISVLPVLKQIAKNPLLIAIVLGIAASLLDIVPPKPIETTVDLLAATVGGLALFTVGGMLAGLQPTNMAADLLTVAVGKLILHPLCVLAFVIVIPSTIEPIYSVALILAAMPMFGVYAIIGERYRMGTICSATLLATTATSFLTLNLAIYMVNLAFQ